MTHVRPARPAAVLALVLMLGACSRGPATADPAAEALPQARLDKGVAEASPPAAPPGAAGAPPPEPSTVTGPGVDADSLGSATLSQVADGRPFIRTAQVDCQVQDVQRAALRMEDLAARFGGFVTRSDVQTDVGRVERRAIGADRLVELATYTVRGDLQMRVPSDRAQAFLRAAAAEMEFLDRRHFEAVDAQFELLRRALARARHDDAQAALGRAADAGGRLGDRADAIVRRGEQQAARDEALVEQRGYEDRVAFATLDIAMHQPERVRRAERPDVDAVLRHEGPGFASRLGDAIADGWRGLLALVLGAVSIWPLWLAVGLALALVRAWRRRPR